MKMISPSNLRPLSFPLFLIPLINGLFLLLLFLIANREIVTLQTIPLAMIKAQDPWETTSADLLLLIDEEETIYLGAQKELAGPSNVTAKIKEMISMNALPSKPTIVIKADRSLTLTCLLPLVSELSALSSSIHLAVESDE